MKVRFPATVRLLALLLVCHYNIIVSAQPVAAANGILQRTLVLEDGDLLLTLNANVDAGTLTVDMTYAALVWIGFAFSNDNLMVPGSVAVIFEPGVGFPQVYRLNERTLSGVVLQQQNSLTETVGLQTDTHTTMAFTKPLVQEGFPTVSTTEVNRFLYAVGQSNTLGYHMRRAAIEVSFAETDAPTPTPTPSRDINVCNLFTLILQFLLGWLGFRFCDP